MTTGILVADLQLSLFPEPPNPDSPYMAVVCSDLPPLDPRVCGCKPNFVCWPFKRVAASLAVSPHWTETQVLFTARCYIGDFSSSGSLGWGAQLGVQNSHFSEGTPLQLVFASRCSPVTRGSPASHLAPLLCLPVLMWLLMYVLVTRLLSSQSSVGYSG